jgi:hypothetical protein
LDPIAGLLMLASGITLIAGLLSESAIMTMFGQHTREWYFTGM